VKKYNACGDVLLLDGERIHAAGVTLSTASLQPSAWYEIKMSASNENNPQVQGNDSVLVEVRLPALAVVVLGGDFREVSSAQATVLEGSIVSGEWDDNSNDFEWHWGCASGPGHSVCRSKGTSAIVEFPKQRVIAIPEGVLLTGTHIISVEVIDKRHHYRVATTTVSITVVESASLPIVLIHVNRDVTAISDGKVNSHDKIALGARVLPTTGHSNVTMQWSTNLDLSIESNVIVAPLGTDGDNFVLNGGFLEPGLRRIIQWACVGFLQHILGGELPPNFWKLSL
jgi:hypothetical protein